MKERTLKTERLSVAQIDGYQCVNCGTCEEYCPAGAISERQKTVCHLCPDCTEMKALNVPEMEKMRTESCTLACPLGISPQGYINLLKAGKEKEAYELILDKNPIPFILFRRIIRIAWMASHADSDTAKAAASMETYINITDTLCIDFLNHTNSSILI